MTSYFASWDISGIDAGTLTFQTPGFDPVVVNLQELTQINQYGTTVSAHNHIIGSSILNGLTPEASYPIAAAGQYPLGTALYNRFVELALLAGWGAPWELGIALQQVGGSDSWRYIFDYYLGLTHLVWSTDTGRRLFGFEADYVGDPDGTHFGTQLPRYIVVAALPGASSVSAVYEESADACAGYSASGYAYGLSRFERPMLRDWVQQYEPRARVFREYAAAAPNEYTYQDLFVDCRSGLPFAVHDGFEGDAHAITGYHLRNDADSFHAVPCTPGNADQFHVPFKTYIVGKL